jgi:hypothetical protein
MLTGLDEVDGERLLTVRLSGATIDADTVDLLGAVLADAAHGRPDNVVLRFDGDGDGEAVTGDFPSWPGGARRADMRYLGRWDEAISRLSRLEAKTFAAYDGRVGAAAVQIGLVTDLRLASTRSRLSLGSLPEGRSPGMGAYWLPKFMRARELATFERPRGKAPDRADFWIVRGWLLVELIACAATGHIVAWLIQFFIVLWFNTFLVVASHDFEEADDEEAELAAIPERLRDDWAVRQICLSYDLKVVGNRWVDLFLSAGLSPHRVHHVLPYQGSGFANLATESTVREVCEENGIVWERPRNLLFERFPAVMKHYLLCPVKAAPPRPPAMPATAQPVPRAASSSPAAAGARAGGGLRLAAGRRAVPLHGRRLPRGGRLTGSVPKVTPAG